MQAADPRLKDQLFLTTLPNGRDRDGKLRLSLLLTPALNQADLREPFLKWPDYARRLSWTVTIADAANHNPIAGASNIPATIDADSSGNMDSALWTEIFRGVAQTKKRAGTTHLHRTWRHSHNSTALHQRHQMNRLGHAYAQLSARGAINASASHTALRDRMTPPVLFLHPSYNSDLAARIDDREKALAQWAIVLNTVPATHRMIVTKRVEYASRQLKSYGGADLSAVSLAAVYILCLQSAIPPGRNDAGIVAAGAAIKSWFTPMSIFQAGYEEIDTVVHYVGMIVFHRRKIAKRDLTIKPPDFHQVLGMVHNYPAIMRTLGLVYDLVIPSPGLTGDYAVQINLNTAAGTGPQVSSLLDVASVFTRCTITTDSISATPQRVNAIKYGLLNLQIPSVSAAPGSNTPRRFSLVPEDAEGHSMKLTDQVNNQSRGVEYQTSAPTSLQSSPVQPPVLSSMTPSPRSVNPSSGSTASRTVGLALFDQDRLIQIEQSAGKVAPVDNQTPTPPTDFYAEDLVLGYRVDIFYKGKFFSLCERKSQYDIYTPKTNTKVSEWVPSTLMERRADEGFVSFGATQSKLDDSVGSSDDSTNTQTQVHQSVFTWTGWSLSVPQPGLPKMNPPSATASDADQTKNKFLAICPHYELPDGGKLPPLRFDTNYRVRCRVVDLAGNSAAPNFDLDNSQHSDLTLAPATPFSRHEPIRAPHFLLLQPIDRASEPGTQVDRMVARDSDTESERMLVPPRESLRLAELSSILTNDHLPGTAFANQQLLEDGSFPSVACAKHEGWIPGNIDPADSDPVFLRRRNGQAVKNPYYSDPLANYIRVEAVALTDDPDLSIPIDVAYIPIAKGQRWPDRLPARIRLIPEEGRNDPRLKLHHQAGIKEKIGLFSVPTLDVMVPEASTVVLGISSAAVRAGGEGAETEHPVHLYHLNRVLIDQAAEELSRVAGMLAQDVVRGIGNALSARDRSVLSSPHTFVDGSLGLMTPARTMTLVHAVKQPLDPPEFAPPDVLYSLRVVRDAGKPEAHVSGSLRAHWPSTGKITCYARWSDKVDDTTKNKWYEVHHHEVAFTVTAKELVQDVPSPAKRFRALLDNTLVQHFTDTRACRITYSLVASTNFSEYYPGADLQQSPADYQRPSTASYEYTVLSSARPPAPSITYVIPAFVWTNHYDGQDKSSHTGRTVVLRVYLERPFLVSGDKETLGVVLVDKNSTVAPKEQNYVSRWGADPTRPITTPIQQNELTEDNLCEADLPPQTCTLSEGGTAVIKPCRIQYSQRRQLWFADIPINTQNSNGPFVRLALVRWQPDALDGSGEARCSPVVFAEFTQVSPGRWVSVQKRSGSKYAIAISGAFAKDPSKNPFSVTLQQRWYATTGDTGWREVKPLHPITFAYTAPDSNGLSIWSTNLETPHSAYVCKYRILLREKEFSDQESRKSFLAFAYLP